VSQAIQVVGIESWTDHDLNTPFRCRVTVRVGHSELVAEGSTRAEAFNGALCILEQGIRTGRIACPFCVSRGGKCRG
jgi:hypothetical protein